MGSSRRLASLQSDGQEDGGVWVCVCVGGGGRGGGGGGGRGGGARGAGGTDEQSQTEVRTDLGNHPGVLNPD